MTSNNRGRTLRQHHPEDLSPAERRRGLARVLGFVLLIVAAGFAVAAALILFALQSGTEWVIQGKVVTRTSMLTDLVFFTAAFIATSLLAWYWYRVLHRRL